MLSHLPERLSAARRRRSRTGEGRSLHVLQALVPTEKELGIHRRRRWNMIMKYSGLLLLVGLSTWGLAYGARDFLQAQNDFRISKIEVFTTGGLTREEILAVAQIHEGDSLLGTELQSMRERLELHPWVKSARLEKKASQSLLIELEERRPVAWLTADRPLLKAYATIANDGGLLIDDEGYLLPVHELNAALTHLPIIHTPELPSRQPGTQIQRDDLLAAVNLIKLARESFSTEGLDIVEIEACKGWSVDVKFSDDSSASFGTEKLEEQLNRLSQVRRWLRVGAKRLGHANVMCAKNVPVRLRVESHPQQRPVMPAEEINKSSAPAEASSAKTPLPESIQRVSKTEQTIKDYQEILR